jgi:hypothetical protein
MAADLARNHLGPASCCPPFMTGIARAGRRRPPLHGTVTLVFRPGEVKYHVTWTPRSRGRQGPGPAVLEA